tara:strand:+ start:26042 stop:26473 length:432 start_codon:yes stop_codon:yes gene_type:complete
MSHGKQTGFYRHDEASAETDKMEMVGGVQNIGGLKKSADAVDATPYSDTGDDFREYEYGLRDGGELSITVRYGKTVNTQADALEAAHDAGDIEIVQIKFPAPISKKMVAKVLVTAVDFPTEKEGKLERTFTLKVTGKPEWSAV